MLSTLLSGLMMTLIAWLSPSGEISPQLLYILRSLSLQLDAVPQHDMRVTMILPPWAPAHLFLSFVFIMPQSSFALKLHVAGTFRSVGIHR